MLYPDFLKKQDVVGVTAPSDGNSREVDYKRLENGIEKLTALGYPVKETENVRTSHKGRSSSKEIRVREFMDLIMDPQVKAIISAKGGDFLCEILKDLDFGQIAKHPKWIQGYSDNTGILFPVTTLLDIATIYGNNFNDFGMACWHASVFHNFEILKGNIVEQESFDYYEDSFHDRITGLEGYEKDQPVLWNHTGTAGEVCIKGRLLGGCLDVLLNLVGTKYVGTGRFIEKYKEDGILWYLESFSTDSESLVRSLWQLREAGWFSHASGFIFGRPCFYRTETETSYEEAAMTILEELKIPVIFQADIGHRAPSFTIINGALGTVWCGNGKGRLRQELI